MTDSDPQEGDVEVRPKPGKRDRLVSSARQLFYEQGVEKTSLADIADGSGVPIGNVYYYFKTKDELVEAVIDCHAADIEAMLASLERYRTPKARLKALLRVLTDQRDVVARYGCPQGSLCQELEKRDDGLDGTAARLLQTS